jgi:hypothetical protein
VAVLVGVGAAMAVAVVMMARGASTAGALDIGGGGGGGGGMEFPTVGEKRAAFKEGATVATASSAADPKQPKHTTTETGDAPAPFPVGSYDSVALEPGPGVRGKEEGGFRGDVVSFNAAKGTCVVKQEGQTKGRGITFATSRLCSPSRSYMANSAGLVARRRCLSSAARAK